ncbi:hypothetical protein TrST_g5347, partial [Triparma strigata]
ADIASAWAVELDTHKALERVADEQRSALVYDVEAEGTAGTDVQGARVQHVEFVGVRVRPVEITKLVKHHELPIWTHRD